MEANKFEKQIKEQLQGREIRPSKEAWDRISGQLEGSENPKTSTKSGRFLWYGIAAGFIGILFLSVMYLTSNDASVGSEIRVSDRGADSVSAKANPSIFPENENAEEGVLADVETRDEASSGMASTENAFNESTSAESQSIENTSMANKPTMENTVADDAFKSDAVASSDISDRTSEKVALPLNASDELIHTKVAEVIAQVELLENRNDSVTEAEIDSLLRDAQREILADKIFRNDHSVDAMALLADVEQELDQSFRDQIFDALKDGFLKVRTAVADRNK